MPTVAECVTLLQETYTELAKNQATTQQQLTEVTSALKDLGATPPAVTTKDDAREAQQR
jgi:hypothetical protein